ncbi:hypothetical protein CR513_61356, partial [Mucuna pruriens]
MKSQSIKKYLTRFNSVTVQVNDPDQNRLAPGRVQGTFAPKQGPQGKANPQQGGKYKPMADVTHFIPLKFGRYQILREVYHINLLEIPLPIKCQLGPARDEWCEFHHDHRHTTKNYKTMKSQIEKLIHEGHLSHFVHTQMDMKAKEHNHPQLDRVEGQEPTEDLTNLASPRNHNNDIKRGHKHRDDYIREKKVHPLDNDSTSQSHLPSRFGHLFLIYEL